MTESFENFIPSENKRLTDEENEIFSSIFGESDDSSNCDSSDVKIDKNKAFYDCSYNTILFAILITIIFLILACPAASIWFGCYVPDPYFNLITRALIFFILVFFVDLLFSYYTRDGVRNHDTRH